MNYIYFALFTYFVICMVFSVLSAANYMANRPILIRIAMKLGEVNLQKPTATTPLGKITLTIIFLWGFNPSLSFLMIVFLGKKNPYLCCGLIFLAASFSLFLGIYLYQQVEYRLKDEVMRI